MPRIPNFSQRWERYKRSAAKIKPEYFAKGIGHDAVARLIPRDAWQDFPANGEDHITGSAFGMWITKDKAISNDGKRVEHFEKATGVSIGVWTNPDEEAFETAIRRAAKEALSWGDLKKKARSGLEIVKLSPPPAPSTEIEDRFIRAGQRRHKDVEIVWPGCQARVKVPLARPPAERDDRRVWMLAEYPDGIYLLDPLSNGKGRAASQVRHGHWTPSGRTADEGFIMLPRGTPDYVWIDPQEKPGLEFELFALVINLSDEEETVIARFDAMERSLFAGKPKDVLDEVATFLDHHEIPPVIYHRPCRVKQTANPQEGTG